MTQTFRPTSSVTPEEMALLLRAAFDASSDGMVVQVPTGEIIASNLAAERILGLTADQIRGRTSTDPCWRAIHDDGSPFPGEEHPAMVALRTNEAVRDVIMGVHKPDGVLTWIRIDALPISNAGVAEAVATFFADVTSERSIAGELADSQDQLRRATRAGRVGLWEWRLGVNRVLTNDVLYELLGRPELRDGLAFEAWIEIIHQDDRQHVGVLMQSVLEGAPAVDFDFRILLPDGSTRWMQGRGEVIEWVEGRPTRMVGSVIDVTEVRETRNRLGELFEQMTDAYMALDDDFCFTFVNSRAEQVLRKTREQLIGKSIWDLFPDAVGTAFETTYRRVVVAREPAQLEAYFARFDAWYEVFAYPLADGFAVHFRDVTARHLAEEERQALLAAEREARAQAERARAQMEHAALHDPLTGLPNRTLFLDRVGHAIAAVHRETGGLAVTFIDLDRFKVINDSLGHHVGDELLVEAARRLTSALRTGDTVARLGGDEFAVLSPGVDRAEDAEAIVQRVLDELVEPIVSRGQTFYLAASAGIALGGRDSTATALLRDADAAMYRSKDKGRGRITFYDEELHRGVSERLNLTNDLRSAIGTHQFFVVFQPKVDLLTGLPRAAEALLRWNHPSLGLLAPDRFISLAEETGLIVPIGRWVIDEAVRVACQWRERWPSHPMQVAVNLSLAQLADPTLVRHVEDALVCSGLPPDLLALEITESTAMADPTTAAQVLSELHALGVQLAVDDFGTGYSSLAYLQRLPLSALKIDRCFVSGVGGRKSDTVIVQATIGLAHALGLVTIAEGVETEEQAETLRMLDCDLAQGYLFSRPIVSDAFEVWVDERLRVSGCTAPALGTTRR